jgi:transposase
MTRSRHHQPTPTPQPTTLHKPKGHFHPRVEKVGPAHFGIVCIDCHKHNAKWMLADFFGRLLIPPQKLLHTRKGLEAAVAQLRQARTDHRLRDLIVVLERTGRYHHLARRAFAQAGFETRILHPFATKQFRQVDNPGYKTDDADLAAMHQAALNGCALLEPERDEFWTTFLLLVRYRRDLVRKAATLRTQIHHALDAALPGYAACFKDLWKNRAAWPVLRRFPSPQAITAAGLDGLADFLDRAGLRYQQRSLVRILAWAEQAPEPDIAALTHHRLALGWNEDRRRKAKEIKGLERELAGLLARTPYALLLSCPGLNVVTVADLAGELGPISHYANAQAISGRAGLRPARYQSAEVDRSDGPLRRCCHRQLRAALLRAADCLLTSNRWFKQLSASWTATGRDPRWRRVKVASRLCRILYEMVAGQQVFCHPKYQGRHYLLKKLATFHQEHGSDAATLGADLEAAVSQLPAAAYVVEARQLRQEGRRRGSGNLREILPKVLARLGAKKIESGESHRPSPR